MLALDQAGGVLWSELYSLAALELPGSLPCLLVGPLLSSPTFGIFRELHDGALLRNMLPRFQQLTTGKTNLSSLFHRTDLLSFQAVT